MKKFILLSVIFLFVGLLFYPPLKSVAQVKKRKSFSQDSVILLKKKAIEANLDTAKTAVAEAKKATKAAGKNIDYIKENFYIGCCPSKNK